MLKKVAGWRTELQGIAFCAEVIFHGLRATVDLPFVSNRRDPLVRSHHGMQFMPVAVEPPFNGGVSRLKTGANQR